MTKFYLTHLYPKKLSIYGDFGNILAMQFLLKKMGLEPVYQTVEVGQDLPDKNDFMLMGGGQDKEQSDVVTDLKDKSEKIKSLVEEGMGILAICGGYQLLGKKFLSGNGTMISGINLFDVETKAPSGDVKSRCVGNLVIEANLPEISTKLVGFENHSGQTKFTSNQKCKALGKVLIGHGNNLEDGQEGCVYKNAIGTYLHGSLLPKNPELTEWFILKGLKKKLAQKEISATEFDAFKAVKIDTSIALQAKQSLIQRFLPEQN